MLSVRFSYLVIIQYLVEGVGWSEGWFTCCLFDRLVVLLVGCPVVWMTGWLSCWLIVLLLGRLVGWLSCWLIVLLLGRLVGWLSCCLDDRLVVLLVGCPVAWSTGWLSCWLVGRLVSYQIDRRTSQTIFPIVIHLSLKCVFFPQVYSVCFSQNSKVGRWISYCSLYFSLVCIWYSGIIFSP